MQNITISNVESGAIINIYANPNPDKSEKEDITISNVDKYSIPLKAEIEKTAWGNNHFRVSFILKNNLSGQAVQQNYLTYSDEKMATQSFNNIVNDMKTFKKESEKKNLHSSLIIPKIWRRISSYKDDLHPPESDDLLNIMNNDDIISQEDGGEIKGLLIHPVEDHFPGHGGNVKKSNKNNMVKTAMKKRSFLESFDEVDSEFQNGKINISKLMDLLTFNEDDTEKVKNKKVLALENLSELKYATNGVRWIKNNKDKIQESLNIVSELLFEPEKEVRDPDFYDVFIFDADQTLWDGEKACNMEPPYEKNGDVIYDKNGNFIKLKDGVIELLEILKLKGREIGLISKSEREGLEYQEQPVILLLKEFGILNYFNKMVVVDGDLPKSAFIPDDERTLFIDDDVRNLYDVKENTQADVLNIDEINLPKKEMKMYEDFTPLNVIEIEDGDEEFYFPFQDENNEEWAFIVDDSWESMDDFIDCLCENGIEIVEDNYIPKIRDSVHKAHGLLHVKISGERYIPKSEQPEKPNDGKEYELDHKKTRWNGGSDKKDNLQWLPKDEHKKKTQEEGSYEFGGKKRHKELRKNPKKYTEYQRETGKEKVKKEREELGEKGFSELQRQRALKRWKNK